MLQYLSIIFVAVLFHTKVFADDIPLSKAEITNATEELISILKDTKYFDFVDTRIHGWPVSSPQYPWWGTFWSGVTIKKEKGRISYIHGADGADNNGLRVAPYMEAACYASLLWGRDEHVQLTRKMIRGMTSWVLSSATDEKNLKPKVLNRAFYPENVMSLDNGREISFVYEAARHPVTDSDTGTVHIPNNPFYGDIYVRNGRSCDDMGHVIRSLSLVNVACKNIPDASVDIKEAREAYARWAKDVDDNKFVIPTLDKNGEYSRKDPAVSKAYSHHLFGLNPMCLGTFAIRLLHGESTKNFDCGEGISLFEKVFRHKLKNDAIEVVRSHHEAAVAIAREHGLKAYAKKLLTGLSKRISTELGELAGEKFPKQFNKEDVHMLLISANNVGVALKPEEVRWLYKKLHDSYLFYSQNSKLPVFHLFEGSVPDGTYSYEPPEAPDAVYFRGLGMMLGACASPYRDLDHQILDCGRLKEAFQ